MFHPGGSFADTEHQHRRTTESPTGAIVREYSRRNRSRSRRSRVGQRIPVGADYRLVHSRWLWHIVASLQSGSQDGEYAHQEQGVGAYLPKIDRQRLRQLVGGYSVSLLLADSSSLLKKILTAQHVQAQATVCSQARATACFCFSRNRAIQLTAY